MKFKKGHRAGLEGALHLGRAGGATGMPGGFTLVELLVVVAIVGILIIAMGMEISGWTAKYKAEGDIKSLYVDLSNARANAIQTKSVMFVNMPISNTSYYSIFIDNDDPPDGDGALDLTKDEEFLNGNLSYFINSQARQFGFNRGGLIFTGSGVLRSAFWIRIEGVNDDGSHGSPGSEYDCLELVSTRINMGQFDVSDDKCVTR